MNKNRTVILFYRGWDENYNKTSWYYQHPEYLSSDYPNYGPHMRLIGVGPESLIDEFCKEMKHFEKTKQCSLERELQIRFTEFCLRKGYYQRR